MKTESDPQLNTKLLQVICQLHEWENQHLDLVQTQAGRYLYLSLVKQLILERLSETLEVTELARACAMSRSHFSRTFKCSTGLPPQD